MPEMTTNFRWALFALSTVAITVASLMPARVFTDAPTFPHADKLIHFVMYGTQSSLLFWACIPNSMKRRAMAIGSILFCTAYGLMMEALQANLPQLDRSFSLADIAANGAGAISATLFLLVVIAHADRKNPQAFH